MLPRVTSINTPDLVVQCASGYTTDSFSTYFQEPNRDSCTGLSQPNLPAARLFTGVPRRFRAELRVSSQIG